MDMRGQRLLLRSVKVEESLVTDYMDSAMEIFKLNTVGPQKYLNTYKKYSDLLNNKAEQEVTAFLKETHSIQGFKSVSLFNNCCLLQSLRLQQQLMAGKGGELWWSLEHTHFCVA